MTASSPLSLTNPTLTYGANIAVSSLYGGGAAMGATSFAVEDFGGDGGYFLLGGVRLSDNLRYTLSAAQMSILRYVAGAAGGSERLEVQDLVGATWSAPSYSTVASVAPAPTLTSQNVSVDEGQTIAVSTLIKSIVNPTGTSTTEYAVTDAGTGGKLILGGVTLTAGKTYDFTAAQFAQLEFVAGATVGADTLTLQSYNGSTWSNAVTATVTIDPPPTVTVNNQIVVPGQSVWGQNFIAGVSDAAGYGASEFALMNAGADGGEFYLNGTALPDGEWLTLNGQQLSELIYVAGAGAGTDSVSVKVFDGHAWSAVSVATVTQTTMLNVLTNASIEKHVAQMLVNGSLSYTAMLTILQDAELTGMNKSKFATLQTLASMLNTPGGITVSAYVRQITQDLVDGNSANAYWNGGSSTATPLGNLTATTSQTQYMELIAKWFTGGDLPGTSLTSIGVSAPTTSYVADYNPLYGSTDAPAYTDVNQGEVGDCYFMASIAEVALQDPTGIESMFTYNGNQTYGVGFLIDGQADYVTVNTQLPNMPAGYQWANDSNLEFANGSALWPELLEKAFAELNEQTNVPHGATLSAASDSYAGIDGGYATALTELTGQSVTTFSLDPTVTNATLASDNLQLQSAFANKQELLVSTPTLNNGNLVGDHMFEVVGFTAAANALDDVITLQNPWNTAASTTLAMNFTETLGALAADNCDVYMTTGKPAA